MASAIEIEGLRVSYNGSLVVKGVSLAIPPGKVTAIIGPSGCGKTTLLRCLNRLSDVTKGCKVGGKIYLDGNDIQRMDPILLRRRVGMVFQKPNPFPMSLRDNVLYGVRAARMNGDRHSLVESSLTRAGLWEEVKDRLGDSAFGLSVGQQQRLCLARSLATSPGVIVLDEPTGSLDPLSASVVESSIMSMRNDYTVVIVTHNMQQALRVSDYTAFMYLGEIVESGETSRLFKNPQKRETKKYIAGRFG
jgi:phosphate transport system ATP-binding protein